MTTSHEHNPSAHIRSAARRNQDRDTKRVAKLCHELTQLATEGEASKYRRKMIRLSYLLSRVYPDWSTGVRLKYLRESHRPIRFYKKICN